MIESNEGFAAQACAVDQAQGFNPEHTKPEGSGRARSSCRAAGAVMSVKLLYQLERGGRRYGLATTCPGGGQGIAMVLERLPAALH